MNGKYYWRGIGCGEKRGRGSARGRHGEDFINIASGVLKRSGEVRNKQAIDELLALGLKKRRER